MLLDMTNNRTRLYYVVQLSSLRLLRDSYEPATAMLRHGHLLRPLGIVRGPSRLGMPPTATGSPTPRAQLRPLLLRCPDRVIDYVRLNLIARAAEDRSLRGFAAYGSRR